MLLLLRLKRRPRGRRSGDRDKPHRPERGKKHDHEKKHYGWTGGGVLLKSWCARSGRDPVALGNGGFKQVRRCSVKKEKDQRKEGRGEKPQEVGGKHKY